MSLSPILWTLGLNHESAPIDVRARFAVAPEELGRSLAEVQAAATHLPEVALLCTCNRTELYALGSTNQQQLTLEWLAKISGLSLDALKPYLYIHEKDAAVHHVLRVASGLDSMVLGEPQILGQVKDAVRAAQDAGTLGTTLHQLFKQAFSVAKDVRTHTEIGTHSISMAAASTRLASSVFEDWQHTQVLLVGAGEMIELCAAHFATKNPKRLAVANRTVARAAALSQRFSTPQMQIETLALAEIPLHLHEFDVVVSSTASTLPIIGLGAVERALKARKHRPIVMIDLAVPRDIEPEVKDLPDVYLYTVDDLSRVVQTNLTNRAAAVSEAERFIQAGVTEFVQWQTTRATAVPKIQALNEQAALWQEQEMERIKKQFFKNADFSQSNVDAALQALSRNLTNKFLHQAYKHIAEKLA